MLTTFLFVLTASLDTPQIFPFYYASKETIKSILMVFLPLFLPQKMSWLLQKPKRAKTHGSDLWHALLNIARLRNPKSNIEC